MDEAAIRKLNEITKWIDAILSNSKPIHELIELDDSSDLYVAASNGTETGKIKFKPNEVSKEDFENLKNMQLGSDADSMLIWIEDGDGNVLTTLNIDFFTRNVVKYTEQFNDAELQRQARLNIDAVGNPEMEALVVPDWSTQLDNLINF